MDSLYIQEAQKCLEDKIYTDVRMFFIKTSDGRNFNQAFNYCKKCKSYITGEGMEKDEKKVALGFLKIWSPSYELSDIIKIEVEEP